MSCILPLQRALLLQLWSSMGDGRLGSSGLCDAIRLVLEELSPLIDSVHNTKEFSPAFLPELRMPQGDL